MRLFAGRCGLRPRPYCRSTTYNIDCTYVRSLACGRPIVEDTFFTMFLFAVGYGAGPQFFPALQKDGLPQVLFTLIVCCTGLLAAYVAARLLGYGPGLAAGLLAGGYTN